MPQSTIPQAVVDKDHELDNRTNRASEALAKHRWHNILDPDGPRYTARAYAAAVGRNHGSITRYAKGYALFVERASNVPPRGDTLTIQDAIRLADQSAEQQAYSEAIAEGSGRPVAQVARGDNRHRTNAIVSRAQQRAERRGGDPVEHAREIAAEERRITEANRARHTQRTQRRSTVYVHIEGDLAYAQRRLMHALHEAEGVDFLDEEMELIRDSLAKVKAVLNLLDLRMAGRIDIDWDAEMANLGLGGED